MHAPDWMAYQRTDDDCFGFDDDSLLVCCLLLLFDGAAMHACMLCVALTYWFAQM